MDEKEWMDLLVKSCEANRGKYTPWWDADTENCMYRYDLFTAEQKEELTKGAGMCGTETLSAPCGTYGLTPFHMLVWCGLYDAVADALKRGVDAGVPAAPGKGSPEYSCEGVTPLMVACYRGNLDMAGLLLEHGADAAVSDKKGRNVYHFLAGSRLNKALANDYEIQRNGMGQREPIARLLLGGDINAKDEQGMTPLQIILENNTAGYSWALTEVFLEKGADAGLTGEDGDSLLLTAIRNNHMTAALKLMEDKGLVNRPNEEGETPLHLAVERRRIEMCIALLDKGADKNIRDKEGRTPNDMALETQDDDFRQVFTTGRLKLANLGRLTGNVFAGFGQDEGDSVAMGLYLAGRLVREVDEDDDEEMGYILGMLYNALIRDEKCRVLDILKNAGIDFTAPIHSSGSAVCIRDYCLSGNYGVKVIRKFVEYGLDMDEPLIKGRTPADIVASQKGRNMLRGEKDPYFEEAAAFFSRESMEHVDDSGTTAVHEAVRNDHVDMLRVMVEAGVDVNVTQDQPADAGNTPLHVACLYGRAEAVKLLMDSGADDTLQNVDGETPAHLAVMKNRFGRGLEAGAIIGVLQALNHVDIPRNDGKTPLILLQMLGINTVVDVQPILLEKGADVNHTDNAGNTALIVAAQQNCYKGIVKELIRAGADLNAADKRGNTALHYALNYGSQESAIFMVKKGADVNHANNEGVTPMDIAAEKGYDTILALM